MKRRPVINKRLAYKEVEAGEWVRVGMRNHKDQCCDCGLLHRVNFRIVKDHRDRNTIEVQTFRAGRAVRIDQREKS